MAGLALAYIAYLIFHHYASLPLIIPAALGSNGPGHSLGGTMTRQLVVFVSMFLQYLMPLSAILGAFISFRTRRKQAERYRNVSATRAVRRWRSFRSENTNILLLITTGWADL